MAWSREDCCNKMAWFHLKLEDFPGAGISQLVEWFFPGKGIFQTTLFQVFETKEQPGTEPQGVTRDLQCISVPSGSPSSRFRTEFLEEFPSSFQVGGSRPCFLPVCSFGFLYRPQLPLGENLTPISHRSGGSLLLQSIPVVTVRLQSIPARHLCGWPRFQLRWEQDQQDGHSQQYTSCCEAIL